MSGDEREINLAGRGAEVDLDAVKAEIMEEVEVLRKRRGGETWIPDSSGETVPAKLADEIVRILTLDDASFVRAAYQLVLGRPVDSVGYVDVMDRLIDSESRINVLRSLTESTEARSKGVDPSALLGERCAAPSGQSLVNRSFFRRLASWAMRLRRAPAQISMLEVDLRRLSLRVDWLLSQNAALEVAGTEMAAAMNQQLRDLRADSGTAQGALELEFDERLAQLQQAWEGVREGLQSRLDAVTKQYRDLAVPSEALASEARSAIDSLYQLEHRLLVDKNCLAGAELRTQCDRVSTVPEQAPGLSPLIGGTTDVGGELLYLALEEAFRGTEATIRSRFELYVRRVAVCGAGTTDNPVIDLGCGRGQWLQLLKEQGYHARGADSSTVMADLCRGKGLDVECADAVDYLSRLKPASTGMITAFQVIEHLPFEKLLQIVDLSLHALRPGGVLILETPNPENIVVATCSFYADPTRIRPIPPDLLEFLVRARGFGDIETLRLHSPEMMGQSEGHRDRIGPVLDRFNCSEDYAVTAVRPIPSWDDRGHDESHGGTL